MSRREPQLSSEQSRANLMGLVAFAWWASILVLLPFGRTMVDALRSRGLLTLVVTVAFGVAFGLLVAGGLVLRRRQAIESRQWLVTLALVGVSVLLVQVLPRAEERWHFVQYGVLGALFWAALPNGEPRRLWQALLVTALAGWIDEGVQLLLPNRVYDWWDVGLNAISGLAGAGIAQVGARVARSVHPQEARG